MKKRWLCGVETTNPVKARFLWLGLSWFILAPDLSLSQPNSDRLATMQHPQTETHFFSTAVHCTGCHTALVDQAGRDISIATDWRPSMMANAARDPYWQASVRREILDHPQAAPTIESKCATCHMPMARYHAHAVGNTTSVFVHLPIGQHQTSLSQLAADGVSCTLCHQIAQSPSQIPKSALFRFVIDTATPKGQRASYGPYEIHTEASRIMLQASRFEPKQTRTIRQSALCGRCHTLYTPSLDAEGKPVGTLAEQMTYLEWLHSRYPTSHSCQDCHMPAVPGAAKIANVMGVDREGVKQHLFRGGNFFMLELLQSHRLKLGVQALATQLQKTAQGTIQHLKKSSAQLRLVDAWHSNGQLQARIAIHNQAGHKLPSAYPSRRVWLHVVVRDATGAILLESGKLNPSGSIVGNNNDRDPNTFEPHYARIDSSNQVQIYESILGAPNGKPTTGLLTASVYFKDNRLLPQGFDKRTATDDIAVRGAAQNDPDFGAGVDQLTYRIDVAGAKMPLTLLAELIYQPISYRWAHNLGHTRAPEIDRFVGFYKAAANRSAVVLTTLTTQLH